MQLGRKAIWRVPLAVWIGLILLTTGALGLWLVAGDAPQHRPSHPQVLLPATDADIARPPSVETAAAKHEELSHGEPPALEKLRGNRSVQATFDSNAQPGDFVTPPVVSVEH